MSERIVTVQDLAAQYGVPVKDARKHLRAEKFDWHDEYDRWKAVEGSDQHGDMERVIRAMRRP